MTEPNDKKPYIRNCYIMHRGGRDEVLFDRQNLKGVFLDGYVIIPMETYVALGGIVPESGTHPATHPAKNPPSCSSPSSDSPPDAGR